MSSSSSDNKGTKRSKKRPRPLESAFSISDSSRESIFEGCASILEDIGSMIRTLGSTPGIFTHKNWEILNSQIKLVEDIIEAYPCDQEEKNNVDSPQY